MKRRVLRLAKLLVACLAVAAATIGCRDSSKPQIIGGLSDDLYPLGEGNKWVYSDRSRSGEIMPDRIRTVVGRVEYQGKQVWKLKDVAEDGRAPSEFVAWVDQEGLHIHQFDGVTHRDSVLPELRFPLFMGKKWETMIKTYDGGHVRDEKWVYEVKGLESIQTPSGKHMAIRVDAFNYYGEDLENAFYRRTWYAPGFGVVRYQTGMGPEADQRVLMLKEFKRAKL